MKKEVKPPCKRFHATMMKKPWMKVRNHINIIWYCTKLTLKAPDETRKTKFKVGGASQKRLSRIEKSGSNLRK